MITAATNNGEILAHWNYTRREWKIFLRNTTLKQGRFRYVLYCIFGRRNIKIPEIIITAQMIRRGEEVEAFSDINKSIKRVNIRDTGKLNVLEIIYAILENGSTVLRETQVPVPWGKLKEAVKVQERLMNGRQYY